MIKLKQRTHLVISAIITTTMSTRTPMVMPIRIILLFVDLDGALAARDREAQTPNVGQTVSSVFYISNLDKEHPSV